MQIAASSCVMIGVQGAGLQWSIFMPSGCVLIEIAWPSKHWSFYYRGIVVSYGVIYYGLAASAVVNWAAYEQKVREGSEVSGVIGLMLLK